MKKGVAGRGSGEREGGGRREKSIKLLIFFKCCVVNLKAFPTILRATPKKSQMSF